MTVETHICNSKAFIVLHKHADVAVPRFLKGLNLQQIPLIKKEIICTAADLSAAHTPHPKDAKLSSLVNV